MFMIFPPFLEETYHTTLTDPVTLTLLLIIGPLKNINRQSNQPSKNLKYGHEDKSNEFLDLK